MQMFPSFLFRFFFLPFSPLFLFLFLFGKMSSPNKISVFLVLAYIFRFIRSLFIVWCIVWNVESTQQTKRHLHVVWFSDSTLKRYFVFHAHKLCLSLTLAHACIISYVYHFYVNFLYTYYTHQRTHVLTDSKRKREKLYGKMTYSHS